MDKNTRELIDIVNQRIKELNSLYRMAARKSNISDGEADIWSVILNSDEEYTQQDIVEMLSLPKQTVNSIIAHLVHKGLVALVHVPGTRNQKVIHITDAGKEFSNEYVKWIFEAEQKAMEQTDINEVQAYASMLEKYIKNLRNEIEKH